jgi:uncharacterized protein (TIGR03086 family)
VPAAASGGSPDLASTLELLERAVGYTRVGLHAVAGARLDVPTPCRGWDLRALLEHMSDSLAALAEAAQVRRVAVGYAQPAAGDPVALLREQACALLAAWTHNDGAGLIEIAGGTIDAALLAAAGSVEIAVHGWDVTQACRLVHPLPAALATELYELLPLVVSPADRPRRFASARAVSPAAGPTQRLLAALGRDPD